MTVQNYEKYWSLTLAFTDFNGKSFLDILKICMEFIDRNNGEPYSEKKYEKLQLEIESHHGTNLISIRKAVNQLVKMGFVDPFLVSYNTDSLEYLNVKTNRKRQSLLSKIVYSKSSFNSAVNKKSELHQLNFLIKTLVENGKLSKDEIIALMLVDIKSFKKGFLDKDELKYFVLQANRIDFIKRKYNQVGYLFNLLNKLDDIVFVDDELYFEDDAKNIFGDDFREERKQRDSYLHRLYKNQLQEESFSVFDKAKCMVEKLAYPVLIASHIKPFIKSNDKEAYDANNGILLSRNMDMLFDLGYISFENDGTMIKSSKLSDDVKKNLADYALENSFINKKRLEYLKYHRKFVFNK